MGRTLTSKGKGKQSKAFNPKRDFLNEAVKDYLRKGGKITKIIDETEGYDRFVNIPEEMPSGRAPISYLKPVDEELA